MAIIEVDVLDNVYFAEQQRINITLPIATEIIRFTDSIRQSGDIRVTAKDYLTLEDSFRSAQTVVQVPDIFFLTETARPGGTLRATSTDSIALTDVDTLILDITYNVSDTIILRDDTRRATELSPDDTITLTDVATAYKRYGEATDELSLTDEATANFNPYPDDTIGLTDEATFTGTFQHLGSDSITLTDRAAGYRRNMEKDYIPL